MASHLFSLLTVCGLTELSGHEQRSVTHVLSILDPEWPDPDFGRYPPHDRTILRFHDAIDPVPGIVLPSAKDVAEILAFGRAIENDPAGADAHLLVHCHAGISRSTAAMIAILAQSQPHEEETAIVDRVASIRPQAWPNLLMIEYADRALGRSGRLTSAVIGLYRRRVAAQPDLAETMTRLGRSRELETGPGGPQEAI